MYECALHRNLQPQPHHLEENDSAQLAIDTKTPDKDSICPKENIRREDILIFIKTKTK